MSPDVIAKECEMPSAVVSRKPASNVAVPDSRAKKARVPKARVRAAVESIEFLGTLPPEVIQIALRDLVPSKMSTFVQVTEYISGIARERVRSPSPTRKTSKTTQPLAAFESQADAARAKLVAQQEVIPAGVLLDKLHFTRQALSKAVKTHRLFTVDILGDRLFPAFFADSEFDRRKLESVAKELGELPGWSKWQFFTTRKASLGGETPLEALKRGRYAEVRRAAIGFAER
jgi:hypothetical protein